MTRLAISLSLVLAALPGSASPTPRQVPRPETSPHSSGESVQRRTPRAAVTHRRHRARHRLHWASLARCESGGRWHIVTPPFFGGLQFNLLSWRAVGGHGFPSDATRREQIHRARILIRRQPVTVAFPVCGVYLGVAR